MIQNRISFKVLISQIPSNFDKIKWYHNNMEKTICAKLFIQLNRTIYSIYIRYLDLYTGSSQWQMKIIGFP